MGYVSSGLFIFQIGIILLGLIVNMIKMLIRLVKRCSSKCKQMNRKAAKSPLPAQNKNLVESNEQSESKADASSS